MTVEAIYQGQAYGPIASQLLANRMNVNALRTNATLQHEEWQELDNAVQSVAVRRLRGVRDLMARGLFKRLTNGMGTTVFHSQKVGEMGAAQLDMLAQSRGPSDRVLYESEYLPMPIIHQDYDISARVLESSRRLEESLETTQASVASRNVAEKQEDILFNGVSYTFGGGSIYGYRTHPSRNTGSLTAAWTGGSADPVADVLLMKQALITDRFYGPFLVYAPEVWETILDEDYLPSGSSNPSRTIRNRIRQIEGIDDVVTTPFLAAGSVVMVDMNPETVRLIIGLDTTNVEWQTLGGMLLHFKVMTINVPQLRADANGRMGIAHYTS